MAQTNKQSMIEVLLNTFTGFFSSMGIQLIIFPLMDIPVTLNENFQITFIFMAFGILKGFIMRRIFNKIWN